MDCSKRWALALAFLCSAACDGPRTIAGDPDASVIATADGGVTVIEGSRCGSAGRDGITSCFPADCNAGQYCDDGDNVCRAGCTSDENCGANEYCARGAGQGVGACTSCVGTSFGPPRASCLDSSRSGVTSCFPADCNPGQYCNDGSNECVVGCSSDANCGPTEYCNRASGAALGVCASCYPTESLVVDTDVQACKNAVTRANECGAVDTAMVAVLMTQCEADAAGAELLVRCIELAGADCTMVRGCFAPVDSEAVEACQQECRDTGLHCADQLPFGAQSVSDCINACPSDPTTIRECLEAAQLRTDVFFGCSEADGCYW